MRNIILVIKNNLYRLSKDKFLLTMIIAVMPIIITLGIFFGQMDDIKGKVAVVCKNSTQEENIKNMIGEKDDKITFEYLDEKVTNTDLIKGVYLAEIDVTSDNPEITSYGKEEVKNALEAALKGEVYEAEKEDGAVTGKVVGFMIMFLFLGSGSIIEYFLEDRKSRVYSRVLSGTVSYFEYTIAQILFYLLVLTIPTLIYGIAIVNILNVDLAMSMLSFAGIIFLIGLLTSSYAALMCNIFKNEVTVEMSTANIGVLTCIFAGCFINIVDTNKVIGFLRDLLPQKRLIDLAINYNVGDLMYVIATIIIFVVVSVVVGKKYYEQGEFI